MCTSLILEKLDESGVLPLILKFYKVELEQSSTDYPVQPAHLEDGETKVAFLLGFFNQNFPLDLPFFSSLSF